MIVTIIAIHDRYCNYDWPGLLGSACINTLRTIRRPQETCRFSKSYKSGKSDGTYDECNGRTNQPCTALPAMLSYFVIPCIAKQVCGIISLQKPEMQLSDGVYSGFSMDYRQHRATRNNTVALNV